MTDQSLAGIVVIKEGVAIDAKQEIPYFVGVSAAIGAKGIAMQRVVIPPGGADTVPLEKMKLLTPADWNDFEKDRPSFAKEWNRIVGAGR